jgi:hypothetical protein
MPGAATERREPLSYSKRFRPETAGVKLAFSPEEMAFSREDMQLRAASARRDVLLSLQPHINGILKKPWNRDVLVLNPWEPFYPQDMHVALRNEHDPDFGRDFDEVSPYWDGMSTVDLELEQRQYRQFTDAARKGTVKATEPLADAPLLVRRQTDYAKKIKEEGIPAAKPPPPFIVKRANMSSGTRKRIHRHDVTKPYHDGAYAECQALGGWAWSCCGNTDENSTGCRRHCSNCKKTLYD